MIQKIAAGVCVLAALAFAENGKVDKAKELFVDVCTSCHTLQRVGSQQLSKEDWRGLIKGMIDEGAAVTEEEFSMIVEYLAKNFGEKKESR